MATVPTALVAGVGELGGVFARGLLKLGHAVYPVMRRQRLVEQLAAAGDPELILLCVGESELAELLTQVPGPFHARVAFVQNELVPRDWRRAGMREPSGVVVWFEKKAGQDVHVVRESGAYGPRAPLLMQILSTLGIPVYAIAPAELDYELALKNLYILVHNLAGLRHGGSVAELWARHGAFASAVRDEVLQHQEALMGHGLDRARLTRALAEAVSADPEHACAGRSAPQRLQRVLGQAAQLGLELRTLRGIAETA